MSMDCYIEKWENISIQTITELEEHENKNRCKTAKELVHLRGCVWLDTYIRTKCKNRNSHDEVFLTEADIKNLVKKLESDITTKVSNFDIDGFFTKDIKAELKHVLEAVKPLLKEDFENNSIYYNSFA